MGGVQEPRGLMKGLQARHEREYMVASVLATPQIETRNLHIASSFSVLAN